MEEEEGQKTLKTLPVPVLCVSAEQLFQSAMFEGLVVMSRSAERYDIIPNTWRQTDRGRGLTYACDT